MALSEKQKKQLRENARNVKVASKLPPKDSETRWEDARKHDMEINAVPFEETVFGFSTDVSRETPPYETITETIPGTASATFEEKEVDDIPFHDAEVGTIKSLVPMNEQAIVEGFIIPPG